MSDQSAAPPRTFLCTGSVQKPVLSWESPSLKEIFNYTQCVYSINHYKTRYVQDKTRPDKTRPDKAAQRNVTQRKEMQYNIATRFSIIKLDYMLLNENVQ